MKEAKAPPSSGKPDAEPASLSPGMATLLRQTNGSPEPAVPNQPDAAARQAAARHRMLVRISLIVADLSLFGFAALMVLGKHGPLSAVDIALCVVAVALGAWLTCLALWME